MERSEVIEGNGGDDGVRTRDLRRSRPEARSTEHPAYRTNGTYARTAF